ncbi:hypothetical protein NXW76_18240 [Bacteroides thetaiotaomicron]|nr:hypothetical protein [Bacteroides thetaiotaomicron]
MKSTITTPDELTTLRIEGKGVEPIKYSATSAPWNPLRSWMRWTGSITWRRLRIFPAEKVISWYT